MPGAQFRSGVHESERSSHRVVNGGLGDHGARCYAGLSCHMPEAGADTPSASDSDAPANGGCTASALLGQRLVSPDHAAFRDWQPHDIN